MTRARPLRQTIAAVAVALLAQPGLAEDIDPADVILTLQLQRAIAALETPEAVVDHLTELMAEVGRPGGIVLSTLTEDRERSARARIDAAVDDLMGADRNGDGALTRLEVSRSLRDWNAAHLETFFTEFDTDGTGRVTLTEVRNGVALRASEVGSSAILDDLAGWDLDRDGIVTPDEVAAVAQTHHFPRGTLG